MFSKRAVCGLHLEIFTHSNTTYFAIFGLYSIRFCVDTRDGVGFYFSEKRRRHSVAFLVVVRDRQSTIAHKSDKTSIDSTTDMDLVVIKRHYFWIRWIVSLFVDIISIVSNDVFAKRHRAFIGVGLRFTRITKPVRRRPQ